MSRSVDIDSSVIAEIASDGLCLKLFFLIFVSLKTFVFYYISKKPLPMPPFWVTNLLNWLSISEDIDDEVITRLLPHLCFLVFLLFSFLSTQLVANFLLHTFILIGILFDSTIWLLFLVHRHKSCSQSKLRCMVVVLIIEWFFSMPMFAVFEFLHTY